MEDHDKPALIVAVKGAEPSLERFLISEYGMTGLFQTRKVCFHAFDRGMRHESGIYHIPY